MGVVVPIESAASARRGARSHHAAHALALDEVLETRSSPREHALLTRVTLERWQRQGLLPGEWVISTSVQFDSVEPVVEVACSGVAFESYIHPHYGPLRRPTAVETLALGLVETIVRGPGAGVGWVGRVTANGLVGRWAGLACEVCGGFRPCGC